MYTYMYAHMYAELACFVAHAQGDRHNNVAQRSRVGRAVRAAAHQGVRRPVALSLLHDRELPGVSGRAVLHALRPQLTHLHLQGDYSPLPNKEKNVLLFRIFANSLTLPVECSRALNVENNLALPSTCIQ